ncbi:hypothetical protein SCP_0413000 [Sparassis crispa]|uniref:Uncharacterized protein n=1 Tax=Sparassis crispa TaxID=139825 RepID=A0A401GL66_9APHY|nr:hypothetical protein SCP_0413000 [Sparassis crispa]GBE82913.1 hypothetical protein SCP_0413000 [Sparassis crispa]
MFHVAIASHLTIQSTRRRPSWRCRLHHQAEYTSTLEGPGANSRMNTELDPLRQRRPKHVEDHTGNAAVQPYTLDTRSIEPDAAMERIKLARCATNTATVSGALRPPARFMPSRQCNGLSGAAAKTAVMNMMRYIAALVSLKQSTA